jgi:hypothetical protein
MELEPVRFDGETNRSLWDNFMRQLLDQLDQDTMGQIGAGSWIRFWSPWRGSLNRQLREDLEEE